MKPAAATSKLDEQSSGSADHERWLTLERHEREALLVAESGYLSLVWRGRDLAQAGVPIRHNGSSPEYGRAIACWRANDTAEALVAFGAAIAAQPSEARLYNSRGSLYAHLGQFRRALQDFSTAILMEPDDWMACANRGLVHLALSRWEEALADFDCAIAIGPPNAACHFYRGRVHHLQMRFPEALVDLDRAVALDPENPMPYEARASVRIRLGDREAAKVDIQEAASRGGDTGYLASLRGEAASRPRDD